MAAPILADARQTHFGLIDLIYSRHSVRAYKPDHIDEPQLRLLLDAAIHAPTAMHEEPCLFVVVQDRMALKRLSDRAKQRASAQSAALGNVLKRPGSAGDGIGSPLADPNYNIFHDAGTLVVICARPGNEFVVADCWLAAENLLLAASAFGLGTCCIGFAVQELNTPESKAELGIPADVHAIAPIIIGVPSADVLPTPRKTPVVLNWIR